MIDLAARVSEIEEALLLFVALSQLPPESNGEAEAAGRRLNELLDRMKERRK